MNPEILLRHPPAGSVWHPCQADLSLPTGAFEEALDGVVPVVVMFLFHTAVRWFKVGVFTLRAKEAHELNH